MTCTISLFSKNFLLCQLCKSKRVHVENDSVFHLPAGASRKQNKKFMFI